MWPFSDKSAFILGRALAPRHLQLWGGPVSTGDKPASACRKPVPRPCQKDARHRARPHDRVGPASG